MTARHTAEALVALALILAIATQVDAIAAALHRIF